MSGQQLPAFRHHKEIFLQKKGKKNKAVKRTGLRVAHVTVKTGTPFTDSQVTISCITGVV